jgi:hypothetical protein
MIIKHRRDNAAVIVDVGGGYGGAVALRLKDNGIAVHTIQWRQQDRAEDLRPHAVLHQSTRAEAWWRMREALDPDREGGSHIKLPPDPELRADLTAPTYEVTAGHQDGKQGEAARTPRALAGQGRCGRHVLGQPGRPRSQGPAPRDRGAAGPRAKWATRISRKTKYRNRRRAPWDSGEASKGLGQLVGTQARHLVSEEEEDTAAKPNKTRLNVGGRDHRGRDRFEEERKMLAGLGRSQGKRKSTLKGAAFSAELRSR